MRWWFVLALAAAVSCDSYRGYVECPPNASCAAPCDRSKAEICSDLPCPEEAQRWVDLCEDGYRGHCECQDEGDGCAGLKCVAGTFCFEGKCLKRVSCGSEVCEPGWSCLFGICVQVVASGQPQPGSMQLAGDTLYFSNQSEDESNVRVVTIGDNAITTLADSAEPMGKLAVDDMNVYYVRGSEDAQLMRVPRSGGDSTVLANGLHVLGSLVLASGRLYWFDRGEDESTVRLMSATTSGDDAHPTELWTRDVVTSGPLIAGDKLYWIERGHSFWRSNLDGSDASQLAATDRENETLHVLATDGERFYLGWSDGRTSGVSVYDADAQSIERIGTDAHNEDGVPVALALDDDTLYVLLHYPKRRMPTTSLFRMRKALKSNAELSHVFYTDADATRATIPLDEDSVYFTSPRESLVGEGPQIIRIRKRW